jgi:chorismate mutase
MGPADLDEETGQIRQFGAASPAGTGIGHDGCMEDELEVLRREIDAVDERFVELLAERFRITRRVGRIKAERGLPAQDAIREAQIDAKVRRLAAEHELDEGLVADVLRAVIDRVVAEHRELHR